MQQFDVVVVGCGPAGGQCARQLAQAGWRVLLLERYQNFEKNSFSSAGTPIATLATFQLPETVVGSFWHQLAIITSHQQGHWQSDHSLGCVLDFTKLRQFLAEQVKSYGGEVWLGTRYLHHVETDAGAIVTLRNNLLNQEIVVQTQVLVDATGPARMVMDRQRKLRSDLINGLGVEYLIEVSPNIYQNYASTLTFFLGYEWIPAGYSWVFPMEANRLKVGSGILKAQHHIVQEIEPLKVYIQRVIDRHIQPASYQLIDIHGATVRYSSGLQDTYSQGRTIAIGDAVSTINFLGGEGIRHAMLSSEIAAQYIQRYLQQDIDHFDAYREEMHRIFLAPWNRSEKLGLKKYLQDSDELVDRVVDYLRPMSLEDVVDVLFYYKFEKVAKNLWSYIWRKLQQKWLALWRRSG